MKFLKYFSLNDSYEENKKMFRILVNQYHPDKPTGNEDMMKEINCEWETVNEYFANGNKHIHYEDETCDCDDEDDEVNNQTTNHDDLFWETIFNFSEAFLNQEKKKKPYKRFVTFKGKEYDLEDEDLLRKIAMGHGGLGLLEFQRTDEWQEYINNYK